MSQRGRFKLKTETWMLVIEKSPALATEQIKARLIPGGKMNALRNLIIAVLSFFLLVGLVISVYASPPSSSSASSAELIWSFKPGFAVSKYLASPARQYLALAGEGGAFALVDLSNKTVKSSRTGIAKPVYLDYAPDASKIWIIGKDKSLARVDPNTAKLRSSIGTSGKPVVWETTIANGRLRLEAPRYGIYEIYRRDATVPLATLKGEIIATDNGELIHRGGAIITASAADRLTIWNETQGFANTTGPVTPPQAVTTAVACNGACIITATAASTRVEEAYLWVIDPPAEKPIRLNGRLFLDHDRSGRPRLASNLKGDKVLVATSSGLSTLQLSTDGTVTVLASTKFHPFQARLSPDGRIAFALESEKEGDRLLIANGQTLQPFSPVAGLKRNQYMAVFGPNAGYALLDRKDGQSVLVDLPNRQVKILSVHGKEWISEVSNGGRHLWGEELLPGFSNTGQWLGIVSLEGRFRLLVESRSGADVKGFSPDKGVVDSVLFTKDDAYMVVEQKDGSWSVWQLNAG